MRRGFHKSRQAADVNQKTLDWRRKKKLIRKLTATLAKIFNAKVNPLENLDGDHFKINIPMTPMVDVTNQEAVDGNN